MKFVVTGTTGQVGWELIRALQPLGEVVPVSVDELDLTDAEATRTLLDRVRPHVVINPAAHTAVDKAETEQRELAKVLNADVPATLAQWCKSNGALLVHYSTDYVFNGEGTRPWKEDDTPAPLNVYGETKLAGEQAIQQSGCAHIIFRTCWVYSLHGGNFLKTMVKLAAERDHLKVVADQIGVPTPASFIADVTAEVIRRRSCDPKLAGWSGILNLAPSGETSWYGYTQAGLKLLVWTGATMVVAPLAGVFSEKYGPRWFMVAGVSLLFAGMFWYPIKRMVRSRRGGAAAEEDAGR